MRKTLFMSLALVLAAAPVAVQAGDDPVPCHSGDCALEHKGTGAGAVLGALVGGPPGAILGAAGGYVLSRLTGLERTLDEREQDLEVARLGLAAQAKAHTEALAAARRQAAAETAAGLSQALAQGLALTVQFRTGSAELEPQYQRQLGAMVRGLAGFPDLAVRLAGYADPRGGEADNLALSQRRVAGVKAALVAAGVDASRIAVTALGEGGALYPAADREAYPFERRVLITFSFEGAKP